jgi:uncharacterized protein (DUF427 family)
MTDPRMKFPGGNHPIQIVRNCSRLIVRLAGKILADTTDAVTLHEARYAPVHYIPRADVGVSMLGPSPTTSYCPYKGEATYYSACVGAEPRDVAWSYDAPYAAVVAIAGRVAFYPEHVDAIEEWETAGAPK